MSILSKHTACALAALASASSLFSAAAVADDWWKDVKVSGYAEAGFETILGTSKSQAGIVFGRTTDDRNDRLQLNQVSLIVQRDIDSKKDYDIGFKLQGLYGTDARYDHALGLFDRVTSGREQFDLTEAWLNFHTPWLGKNGTDIKVGHYITLEGAEVVDPRSNFFYSHSYIYNFGIPIDHTGVLAVTHFDDVLDLYYGVDTGVNSTFGRGTGVPNNSPVSFHGGVGFNLLNGDLTILATTHIGDAFPDQGSPGFFSTNVGTRYLNDVTIVWKTTKQLTLTADLNYIHDDTKFFGPNGNQSADGGGIALYAAYQYNDNLAFGIRGEWFNDSQGAFVGAFPGNSDFVNAEIGRANGSYGDGGLGNFNKSNNYYAVTLAANITPTVPKQFEGFKIRPEIRYDHSDVAVFGGATSTLAGASKDQWTIGGDVIVPFNFTP